MPRYKEIDFVKGLAVISMGIFHIFYLSKYMNYKDFNGQWPVYEKVLFNLDEGTENPVNLMIYIRNNKYYPYSNLYLFIDIIYPNNKHRIDTLECVLADNRGRWYGSGLGDMVSHRIEYLDEIQFPLEGDYQMRITHGMRMDPLEEITDLGLRLENLSL